MNKRKLLIALLALAACVKWSAGTFNYSEIRKCEDEDTICFQSSAMYSSPNCRPKTTEEIQLAHFTEAVNT